MTFAQKNFLIAGGALSAAVVLWLARPKEPAEVPGAAAEEPAVSEEAAARTSAGAVPGPSAPAGEVAAQYEITQSRTDATAVVRSDGSYNPTAIMVAVPGPLGKVEFVRGDDPRAQAALKAVEQRREQRSVYEKDAEALDMTGVTPDNSLVPGGRNFRMKDPPPLPELPVATPPAVK